MPSHRNTEMFSITPVPVLEALLELYHRKKLLYMCCVALHGWIPLHVSRMNDVGNMLRNTRSQTQKEALAEHKRGIDQGHV